MSVETGRTVPPSAEILAAPGGRHRIAFDYRIPSAGVNHLAAWAAGTGSPLFLTDTGR
jgi:hypothetical protein